MAAAALAGCLGVTLVVWLTDWTIGYPPVAALFATVFGAAAGLARRVPQPRRRVTMPSVTRVLMLTNSITPDMLGGLNRYVRELSAALVQTGVPVTVATKRVSPEHPLREVGPDGVEIHRYDVTSKRSPHFLVSYPTRIARSVWRELDALLRTR